MKSGIITCAVAIGVVVLGTVQLLAQSGDVAKGKELYNSNGCASCHRIGDAGSRVGPDLSDIGDRRTPERLKSAIVNPDEEVLPENRYVSVMLKDGTEVKGRLLNHDAMSVQLLDTKEQLRSFETSKIKGYTILVKGLMPSYDKKLSADEVNDLVAYLGSLKGPQQP